MDIQREQLEQLGFSLPDRVTNYDRIISKSPEELATLISENIDCGVCENVFGLRPCSERCCPDFWLDWLKQEATDGT